MVPKIVLAKNNKGCRLKNQAISLILGIRRGECCCENCCTILQVILTTRHWHCTRFTDYEKSTNVEKKLLENLSGELAHLTLHKTRNMKNLHPGTTFCSLFAGHCYRWTDATIDSDNTLTLKHTDRELF